jgi:hypothetical protein
LFILTHFSCPGIAQAKRELAEKCIEKFFLTKDESMLKKIFDKFKEKGTDKILESNIKVALDELDMFFEDDDVIKIRIEKDGEADMNFEEFKFGINRPSKIEQWAMGIPFAKLIASALSVIVQGSAAKDDTLSALADSSERDLLVIADAMRDGIVRLVLIHIKDLKAGYVANQKINAATNSQDNQSKFAFGDLKTMACGNIKDFYAGLDRVGLFLFLLVSPLP